jgi:hypothetical protein
MMSRFAVAVALCTVIGLAAKVDETLSFAYLSQQIEQYGSLMQDQNGDTEAVIELVELSVVYSIRMLQDVIALESLNDEKLAFCIKTTFGWLHDATLLTRQTNLSHDQAVGAFLKGLARVAAATRNGTLPNVEELLAKLGANTAETSFDNTEEVDMKRLAFIEALEAYVATKNV